MRIPKYGYHNLASPLLSFWSLWTAFTHCCPLSWRSFYFRCVVEDPCFIHCHIPAQKILFTSFEQLQTALWIIDALLFLVGCEQTWYPLRKAISRNFNLRSPKIILWTFVIFSGTTADFGRLERSVSSVFERPRLNSACQSLIVDFPSAESP